MNNVLVIKSKGVLRKLLEFKKIIIDNFKDEFQVMKTRFYLEKGLLKIELIEVENFLIKIASTSMEICIFLIQK